MDTGCVVALEPSVDLNIEPAGEIKPTLFGGGGAVLGSFGDLIDGENR